MGWSNTGAAIVTATKVVLVDANGNTDGTLDGVTGLVFYGNGSANNPGLLLTPFGDLVWGGDASLTSNPSIEIGAGFDGNSNLHPEMKLTSGAFDAGQTFAQLTLVGADAAGDPGGVMVGPGLLLANNPNIGPSPVPEVWHTLSLQNGWASIGAPYDAPSYRVNALGAVEFKGIASGGTATSGTLIATLPAGYIPTHTRQVTASANGGTSPFVCLLHVAGSNDTHPGQITLASTSGGAIIGFDGVSCYLA